MTPALNCKSIKIINNIKRRIFTRTQLFLSLCQQIQLCITPQNQHRESYQLQTAGNQKPCVCSLCRQEE